MRDLLVVVPTRKRPESVRRFAAAFRATASAAADLMLVVDEDDEPSCLLGVELDIAAIRMPRRPLVPKINEAATRYARHYDAIMFAGDDNVPITIGWDVAMMAALGAGTAMAYANDLSPHAGAVPCSVLMASTLIQALGWMAEPSHNHYFIDNVWRDLGNSTGALAYLPEVIIDHRHWAWGKAPDDDTYSSAMRQNWSHDEVAYAHWKAERMDEDIATVKAVVAA